MRVGRTGDENGGSGLEEPVAEFVEGRPVEAWHGAGPRPHHTTARDVMGDMVGGRKEMRPKQCCPWVQNKATTDIVSKKSATLQH